MALGQFDGGGAGFRRIEKDGLPGHARHEAPKKKVGDAHVVSEQRPDLETSPARAENTVAGKTFIADDAQGLPSRCRIQRLRNVARGTGNTVSS